ncbi:MAG: hydantoinase/oxoprolinase family protein, partial [Planctomycetota bacterium]|nr:hydantoinase/oxoprolinase family protein [Planctomycetota bacterium]
MSRRWRIRVDVGGTFTDAVGRAPDGSIRRAKTPSDGTLRGRVVERIGNHRVRVHGVDGPDGFLNGVPAAQRAPSAAEPAFDAIGPVRSFRSDGTVAFDGPVPEPGAHVRFSPPEEAPVVAARRLTATPFTDALPPIDMRLATTRGTNAVLTRRIARTAFVATRGFRDLLWIADQRRPDLFSLERARPAPLAARTYEIDARAAADGTILARPGEAELDRLAARLRKDGVEAIAVALLHGVVAPALENEVVAALRERGFDPVVASHESGDRRRYLQRAQTAVVDAALTPLFRRYLASVRGALSGGILELMTSAGGLVDVDRFAPRDGLLSGPAGGVVGARTAAERAGLPRALAFDMGGTSTDVSRISGDPDYRFEHTVGDVTLVSPALAIETVAAGGGSICGFEHGRLFVGPDSAGADPGPACYGAGGPLTLTDVHLLAGRLDPAGLGIPLDADAARRRLDSILDTIAEDRGRRPDPE